MCLHQPCASEKEKAAPLPFGKPGYVRRRQGLQIFRQLGGEVSSLRQSHLCLSEVAEQPEEGKPCSLLMAGEAWRAAPGHRNPAELSWEYPAEEARSLNSKYF